MARRRESLVDVLLMLPWWASVVVAAVAYALLTFAAPAYFEGNQFGAGIALGAQLLAPYAAGFFLFLAAITFVRSLLIKKKFDGLGSIDHIRQLSWRQFESIVGEAFRRRGFAVMENAIDGADGGVDLVLRKGSEKFYVQCKQWKQTKIGVKPVRELYGVIAASDAVGGFFVASGNYTQEARDFANKSGIELIDGAKLAAMIADARTPQPFMDPTDWRRGGASSPIESTHPQCPTCGSEMVRRVAKRGPNAGSEFWGCCTYPKCRGVRAMDVRAV